MTSQSGEVVVLMCGRGRRFQWQMDLRGREFASGVGSDQLLGAMREASTLSDRLSAESILQLRDFLGMMEEA